MVEDNPADVRLVRELLKEGPGDIDLTAVERLGAAMEVLASQPADVLLLDLGLPDSQGLNGLAALQARFPQLPMVVLTSADDEALAVQAVQRGAQDYLPKALLEGRLLRRALRYAIERQRAEAALKESANELRLSQHKYQALVETTSEFIWETDASGRYTYCSPQMRALWGYDPEQMVGMTPFDAMPPEDREPGRQFFQSMIGAPRPFRIETRAYNAAAEVVFLETSGVPFFDEKGRLQGFRGTSRDVTDRRKAEEALRASEAQAVALIRHAPTAIFELDYSRSHLVSANDAMCIISGYSREELLSMDPVNLLGGESRGVFADRMKRHLTGQKIPESIEYEVRKKDGSRLYATLNVSFSPRSPHVALIIAHDITQRREMEKALRVSEESYRRLFDAISDAFCVVEKVDTPPGEPSDYRYVAGNPAYKRIVGRSIPVGRTIRQVFPLVPQEVFDGYDRLARTGSPFNFESDRAVEGRAFENHAFLVPGGARPRIGVIIRDITERERMDEELKRYAEQLAAINREMETFSYSLSHDLRAPLRTLDGFSEAVLAEYGEKLDQNGRDYLRRIRRASQTMSDLIDGMLKLSQIGRTEIRWEWVDLTRAAQSIAEELRAAQPERRVELAVAPGLLAHGDRQLLQILLRNLLDNSWKFTGRSAAGSIEFGAARISGERVFFVRDNGVGFNMKYASKLFGPFQRLHPARDFRGTGVGLATAERIVRRHGGRIWAEAEVDQGATFFFVLAPGPAREEQA